jgi:hypothetical protein
MRFSAESICVIEYICEYESIFEPALAHESGDPRVLFTKNRGRKSRGTFPLCNVSKQKLAFLLTVTN